LKKRSKHIDFRALALAILIFFAFGNKELHHFLAHTHEEVKVCDAQKGETHLHDEEYIHADCSLCDFTFSTFDFQLPIFELNYSIYTILKEDFFYKSSHFSNTIFSKSLRGPPSFREA
jgi:hypothetical protein